jgi:hypothetical protein
MATETLPKDTKETVEEPKRYRFRVLDGSHCVQYDTGDKDGTGTPVTRIRKYRRGEVVETNDDLKAIFDQPGMPPKFEELRDDVTGLTGEMAIREGETLSEYANRLAQLVKTVGEEPMDETKAKAQTQAKTQNQQRGADAFRRMSKEELEDYAEDNEIDLKGAQAKEDMIRLLLAHK